MPNLTPVHASKTEFPDQKKRKKTYKYIQIYIILLYTRRRRKNTLFTFRRAIQCRIRFGSNVVTNTKYENGKVSFIHITFLPAVKQKTNEKRNHLVSSLLLISRRIVSRIYFLFALCVCLIEISD